jgi:hypothetical protein
MMDTATILRAARAKIERPECWTTGFFARDQYGHPVAAIGRTAAKWCAIGVVRAVGDGTVYVSRITDLLSEQLPEGFTSLTEFNDSFATHADILALFDRAIAAAEKEPV